MALAQFSFTTPEQLRGSPTMVAAEAADAAKARGKKVEIVTLGDLFPKPKVADVEGWLTALHQQAAKNPDDPKFKNLPGGEQLYAYSTTNGLPTLRATAAECVSRDTGFQISADEICVGTGGKGALNGGLQVFNRGDRVFLAAPGWPTNYDMFPPGVTLIEIGTRDGILRAEDVKAAIAEHGEPAGILINAPCNPTGANYTAEEREAFFAVVESATKQTLVMNDDPYGKLVFDRDSKAALRRGANEKALFAAGRLALFRTVSKEYGLAGLRVGFVATKNKPVIAQLKMWNEGKGGGMVVGAQVMAQAALLNGDSFIAETVEALKKKRGMLIEGIGKLKKARLEVPQGTIYGWADFSGLRGSNVPAAVSETGAAYPIDSPAAMHRYLVNVAGVCGVPGAPFYAPGSPAALEDWHVRISFCVEEKQLETVLANLVAAERTLEGGKA